MIWIAIKALHICFILDHKYSEWMIERESVGFRTQFLPHLVIEIIYALSLESKDNGVLIQV